MKSACLGVGIAIVLMFAGRVQAAPQVAKPSDIPKETRDEYVARAATIDKEHFAARAKLAIWCIEKNLFPEAQLQLQAAAGIDPKSDELLAVWTQLAEKMPGTPVRISVKLADGTLLKGTCASPPFLLRSENGVRLLQLKDLKGLNLMEGTGKAPVVEVLIGEEVSRGLLVAPQVIVIKSDLGEFNLAFQKIAGFTVGDSGVDPIVPRTPGGFVLNWDQYITQLNKEGLEVVFCVDATGDMGGIFGSLKRGISEDLRVISRLVPNARVGITAYRDWKKYDPEDFQWVVKSVPLMKCNKEGIDKLDRFLGELETFGGGDIPEAVQAGVETSMEKAGWTRSAKKVIIVLGGGPPHPENDGLATTYALCKKFHDKDAGIICCVSEQSKDLAEPFQEMARQGAGETCFYNDFETLAVSKLVFGSKWGKELEKACSAALGRAGGVGQ